MTAPFRSSLVRRHIAALRPVVHGSVAAEELAAYGLTPSDVVDFSVNTNPLGPPPGVVQAIDSTSWVRYPGDDEAPLRAALAEHNRVALERVALGNGSAELLWLIALAVLEPGDRVDVVGPTFGEYARAARVVGAEVHEATSLEDLEELPGARLVFVCNPNNPTGTLRTADEIQRVLRERPDRLVVLDEAYASFAEGRWRSEPLLDRLPNLIVLRSLTKDHALPGLRLGYLLAAAELARAVEAVRPPWSVNAGALRAGLASLEPAAQAHLARAVSLVSEARRLLTDGFNGLGFGVAPSDANFVLVRVGDGREFRRALMAHGLVVRDATSFGLPEYVRVACRLPSECQHLLEVVAHLRQVGRFPATVH
jgi:histidinol-phosphate aminotransferase